MLSTRFPGVVKGETMNARTAAAIATLSLSLALCLQSCSKNSSTSPDPGPVSDPNSVTTTLAGILLDDSGNPIAGGRIAAHGRTATSAENGEFFMSGVSVPKQRCVVTCTGPGWFSTTRGEVPVPDGITQFRVILTSSAPTHSWSAAAGGTATLPEGSEVQIPSGALVGPDTTAYAGSVSIAAQHFDPSDAVSGLSMPGSDLVALSGTDTTLLAGYGALTVEVEDGSGQALELAPGEQATLAIQIAPSLAPTAPATIPLWSLDETTGLWVQEGMATRNGDRYEGSVSHLSTWLCAEPAVALATVCGQALDPNDVPVSGVVVRAGQRTTVTGPDGTFCLELDADQAVPVRVEPTLNQGIASPGVAFGPWSGSGPHDIGVIRTDHVAHVSGALQCGTGPAVGGVYARDASSKLYAAVTDASGAFDLALPGNTPFTFLATSFVNGRALENDLVSPPEDSTTTVGTLQLCSSTSVLVFILSPRNNSLTLDNVLNVSGSVSDKTITTGTLSVNGRPQLFGISNGAFASTAILSPGVNTLRVRVVSATGSVGATLITARFQGELAALTANLVWDTNQTDMDLHMINPSLDECFYAQRLIGGMKLDVDDVTGYGPENISVLEPENGTYHVRIRNYRNTVPTTVTVRVYKGDAMIDEQTHTFGTVQMTFWDVGDYTLP